jgi:hypothetical protein
MTGWNGFLDVDVVMKVTFLSSLPHFGLSPVVLVLDLLAFLSRVYTIRLAATSDKASHVFLSPFV